MPLLYFCPNAYSHCTRFLTGSIPIFLSHLHYFFHSFATVSSTSQLHFFNVGGLPSWKLEFEKQTKQNKHKSKHKKNESQRTWKEDLEGNLGIVREPPKVKIRLGEGARGGGGLFSFFLFFLLSFFLFLYFLSFLLSLFLLSFFTFFSFCLLEIFRNKWSSQNNLLITSY